MFTKTSIWFFFIVLSIMPMGDANGATSKFSAQAVKQFYKDGEFEKVRTQLETFLKHDDSNASRDDRILAYKYLGVVYASKPEGAPQAEAYFFRLFDLSPNVQLTELYVSSTVNNLFEKTKERFLKEKSSTDAVDEFGYPIQNGGTPNQAGNSMDRTFTSSQSNSPGEGGRPPIQNSTRTNLSSKKPGPAIWPWVLGAAVVGGGISLYVLTSSEPPPKRETVFDGTP